MQVFINGSENEDSRVTLISKGDKKAEIIVTMKVAGGVVRDTRHLLLDNGVWKDSRSNRYIFKE